MTLFERYCYPSVMAQDCKDFEWVLLMDEKTPRWCVDRMEELKEGCPQMRPVFVRRTHTRQFVPVFREVVMRDIGETDRVITTYLDNDDAISRTFISEVQSAAENVPDDTVISFERGYQYFCDIRMSTVVEYPDNHFISLVESSADLRTVYGYGSHISIGDRLAVMHIPKPGWVEVVHAGNVDNDVKMTIHTSLVTDPGTLVGEFGPSLVLDSHPRRRFVTGWIPMMLRHAFIRAKQRIKGRDWWN